jgi:hypothetical protein
MSSDTNTVDAEVLSKVYLTNKGTGKTTEVSPPVSRTAPASRVNASTVYVTMTDVDTANAVKNSHIINANKVVITIEEADMNTKVAVTSGDNNVAAAAVDLSDTVVVTGLANNPVIDSNNDGFLTDEIYYAQIPEGTVAATCVFTGSAVTTCAGITALVLQTVSVANGASATANVAPMITAIVTTEFAEGNDTHDVITGYYSSAVNTFQVDAWSTVQLEANASKISVVETGRNTGIFEAEFVVSDTEAGIRLGAELTESKPWVMNVHVKTVIKTIAANNSDYAPAHAAIAA